MDEKPAKTVIYMSRSLKNIFQSQKLIHWTQRTIKKRLSLTDNLFTMTAFLFFAFRSKSRVNKATSCKKKSERKPILLFES